MIKGSMWGLLRQAAIVVACGIAVSACSSLTDITGMGSPLHNEADFQTATTAKETSDAIDYLKPISEERANQARLLEHEMTVVRNFAVARRNHELMALLNDSEANPLSTKISAGAEKRLAIVVGDTIPTLTEDTVKKLRSSAGNELCGGDETLFPLAPASTDPREEPLPGQHIAPAGKMAILLRHLANQAKQCEAELQLEQDNFRNKAGFSGPACPLNGTIEPLDDKGREQALAKFKKARPTSSWSKDDILKVVEPAHAQLVKTCLKVRTNQRAFEHLIAGCTQEECGVEVKVFGAESLATVTMKKLRDARTDRDAALKAAAAAQKDYTTAVESYKKAAAANLDAPGGETQEAVDAAAKDVQDKLKLLTEAGAAVGLEMGATEQIAKIDLLLQAAGSGEIDAEAVKKNPELAGALVVANALPSFVERIKFIAGQVNAPPLSSLILEKARLQAIAADAKRQVERQSQAIALMEAEMEAIVLEAEALSETLKLVWDATTKGGITARQLVQHSVDEQRRERLVVALERYLSSFTGPRQEIDALAYREIALMREVALDKSETSLQIWKATIQTPVDALLAYHGSGLKPEDLIELLKAIGIGVIGAGVI